ncbi:MAG TPA: hypothetical protein VJV74_05400 [Terriglobia bacterium]|nr:hypothetical protein [Terriglobia bacterium]
MDDPLAEKIDQLTARVGELVKLLAEDQGRGHVQKVIHQTQGMGAWGAAAVTACFFTSLMLIGLSIVVIPDLHDLKAWESIFGRDLAAIKQQIQHEAKP